MNRGMNKSLKTISSLYCNHQEAGVGEKNERYYKVSQINSCGIWINDIWLEGGNRNVNWPSVYSP